MYLFLLCYDLMLNCHSYIRRKRFIYIYRINTAVFDYYLSITIYTITVLPYFLTFAVIIIILIVHRCISYMPQKRS